jgi:hypothetical protein
MRRLPWLALGALAFGLGARLASFLQPVSDLLPDCPFKRWTGIPCATCGLTRCVMALGRWDWREAFHWHPAGALVAALLPVFVLWDLRRAWRGEAYPRLPDSRALRMACWGILAGIWALQVARGI